MSTEELAIMIPIIGILGSFLVVIVFVLADNRTRRMRAKMLHDERMIALEKGLPVPMDDAFAKKRRYFRSGLVWCSIGLGLMTLGIVATENDANELFGVGSIPLLIGLALIAGDLIDLKRAKAERDRVISPYLAAETEPRSSAGRS
ncbi:hypothetical protein HZB60_07570 [candidate division KSB1 bacterium]|nr:hypothetical protein [candidate division KSB1 bacterium]